MKVSLVLVLTFAVTITTTLANPQYSYQPPEPQGYSYPKPAPTYLPPPPPPRTTTTTTTTTQRPYVTSTERDSQVVTPSAEHEAGAPYDFTYAVKDDEFANDYKRNEQYDGNRVEGEYRTLLPDGRTQVVRYVADWKNGYNADVTYEGVAKF